MLDKIKKFFSMQDSFIKIDNIKVIDNKIIYEFSTSEDMDVYFVKKDKIIVNDYVSKVFSNEIKLKDKVYMYNEKDQTSVAIEPKQQEKHVFKYKNIEEVIKSKTDIHVKNDDIEWTEIDSLNK